jgi:hypothetical protein
VWSWQLTGDASDAPLADKLHGGGAATPLMIDGPKRDGQIRE